MIALLWQDFAARCYPSPLHPPARAVLGLTVWGIYLLDRLLDVRTPSRGNETARHQFYRKHWLAASILLVAVFAADCAATLRWLRPAVFHAGALLSVCVVVYLLAFHFVNRRIGAPKEVAVAILFAAGTMLVPWTWAAHNWRSLAMAAGTFALLCLGNLVAIEIWEYQELRCGLREPPGKITIWLGRYFLVWVPLLCGLAALGAARWFAAVSLSAGLLSLVFAYARRLTLDARRVLVDVALLSPLLLLK